MALWELFVRGGPLMWPILLCSIVALAIVVERGGYFLTRRLTLTSFLADVAAKLRQGEIDPARQRAAAERSPVAQLIAHYLAHLRSDLPARENILTREVALAISQAQARLRGLDIIAQVAPLLGLLGTVTGMIGAFHDLQAAGGSVNVGILSQGIWNALLTTAFGLAVAIPTLLAHHHFEGRVAQIERQMQYVLSVLNEIVAAGVPGLDRIEPVGVHAGEAPVPVL